MIKGEGIDHIGVNFLLMWTPGFIGLISVWLFSKSLKDIGFKIGSWKYYGLAYGIPLVTAVLILGILILIGQGEFELSPSVVEKTGGIQKALVAILLVATTLNVVLAFVAGLGARCA